jgi:hypothetical protein
MPMRNDLRAETARVACSMAHADALAYSAETAEQVADEAA